MKKKGVREPISSKEVLQRIEGNLNFNKNRHKNLKLKIQWL